MTTVLKVGGSVITDKTSPETVDESALERVATAIATADDLVLVHGGGSFGHPVADRHGVSTTIGTHDARAAWAIHDAMTRLNRRVIDALQDAGAPALPVRPLSVGRRDTDGGLMFPTVAIAGLLAEDFLPVVHGDGVVHDGAGVTVLSGDDLVVTIAEALGADRVGLCSATPGVLDDEGEVVARIGTYDEVATHIEDGPGTDVSGGMGAKVRTLLEYDGPAHIFDLDGLDGFLAGEDPGTLVG